MHGLGERLEALPDGINTRLSAIGAPLMPLEFLLLKIAAAVLTKPELLILNQDFDNVPQAIRQSILDQLCGQPFSVLYYTNRLDEVRFDSVLTLAEDSSGNGSQGVVIKAGGS